MIENLLGFKLPEFIAGFVGGVVSLAFLPELTWRKSLISVIAGAFCAAYFTPLISDLWELKEHSQGASAFLTGLFAMYLLAGLFKIAERFSKDPIKTVNSLRGGRSGDD